MRRGGALALLVLLAGPLAACHTARHDTWIGDAAPPPATRAELYRRYGPPDGIRREGTSTWLRYDSSVTRGATLGFRAQGGVGLVLSRRHTVADRVWVEVAPDGRILAFEPMAATGKRARSGASRAGA